MTRHAYLFSSHIQRMMIRLLAIVLFTSVIANNLLADDANPDQPPKISLDTAVNKVRAQYADGKVLKTEEQNAGNGKIYVIKMITADSRLLHIRVDAQSGQIME